jgi:hypothetical protein
VAAGTYSAAAQSVTITSATSVRHHPLHHRRLRAFARPSANRVFGGAVSVASSKTLKAMAYCSGLPDERGGQRRLRHPVQRQPDGRLLRQGRHRHHHTTALKATFEVKNQTSSGNTRNAYLRFNISSMPATIPSAKVRLYGAAVNSAKALSIYAVATNPPGSRRSIIWNSAPAIGAKQGSSVAWARAARTRSAT